MHCTVKKKPFACKHCKHGFVTKNRLENHEIVCGPKQTRKIELIKLIKCELCDKLFTRQEYRRNHVKQVHKGERPFQCVKCSNAFKEKAALQKHIYALHTGKKPFACKHCNHGFVTKDRLKKHEMVCVPKSDSDSD